MNNTTLKATLLSIVFFTLLGSCNSHSTALQFDTISKNTNLQFWYEKNQNNEFLNLLRSKHPIDSLIQDAKSDTERVQRIMNWVHKQWRHDGNNEPRNNDAISILEEAKEGKNFRCVEYAIVVSACLNAIGLKTRVLGLMTKDVETRQFGAGHVVAEVFLNDLNKWVFIDPQWDAMPVLNGIPLNAVEFQKAIANDFGDLEIKSSMVSKRRYIDWVYPYLYYFDIAFDNREGLNIERNTIDGKRRLMLVPVGSINPTVFQRIHKIHDVIYTNSLNDFYAPPGNFEK